MKCIRNLTLTVYFQAVIIGNINSRDVKRCLERFKGGVCKFGQKDVKLWNTSYSVCVMECEARADSCVSVTYHTLQLLCRMHGNDAEYQDRDSCIGRVYSEKEWWKENVLGKCGDTMCVPGQTCVLGNGVDGSKSKGDENDATGPGALEGTIPGGLESDRCVYAECEMPLALTNGEMFGNMASINNKLKFKCNPGYQLIGANQIVCGANGNWEPAIPTCATCKIVECSSNNYAETTCDTGVSILALYLEMQISGSPCVDKETFWFQEKSITVTTGCRAQFKVYYGQLSQ